jgi:rubrerythrin
MDKLDRDIIFAVYNHQQENAEAPSIADVQRALRLSSNVYNRVKRLTRTNHLMKKGKEVGVTIKGMKVVERELEEEPIKEIETPEIEEKDSVPEYGELDFTGWVCPLCGTVYSPKVLSCDCSKIDGNI